MSLFFAITKGNSAKKECQSELLYAKRLQATPIEDAWAGYRINSRRIF
jgi:hypothetical protein